MWLDKIYRDFMDYCHKNNVIVNNDDIKYIKKSLELHDYESKKKILFKYYIIWNESSIKEQNYNKKQNTGRNSANCFLRNFFIH